MLDTGRVSAVLFEDGPRGRGDMEEAMVLVQLCVVEQRLETVRAVNF